MPLDEKLLAHRFRTSLLSYGFRQLVVMLLTVAYNIVLTHFLMPEEFGKVAVVTLVTSVTTLLADGGLGVYLIQRHVEVSGRDINQVATLQVVVASCFIALAFALTLLANYWLPGNPIGWLIAIATVALPLTIWRGAALLELERTVQLNRVVRVELLEEVAFALVSIVLAAEGFGAWSFVIAQIAKAMVGFGMARHESKFRIALVRWEWNDEMKRGIRFGFHYQAALLIGMARAAVNPIFIIPVLGLQAGGFVERSWYLAGAALSLILAVQKKVLFPYAARLQNDRAKMRPLLESSIYLSAVLDKLLFIPLILFADQIVRIVFGPEWMPMLPLFYLLLSGNVVFGALSGPLYPILNGIGQARAVYLFNLFTFILSWALIVPLVLAFGLVGVGMAGWLLWAMVIWLKRQLAAEIGEFTYYTQILKPLVAAALACAITRFLSHQLEGSEFSLIQIALWCGVAWLIYAIGMFALDAGRIREVWRTYKLV